ncbi:hypothetical protein AB3538_01680 [Acinetobacter baumannii]
MHLLDDDNGEYGYYAFNKHYYGRIGAFDSGEEFVVHVGWISKQLKEILSFG